MSHIQPWTFLFMGYGTGKFAPGRCSNRTFCAIGDSATEPYIAGHNVLLAHASVVEHYRNRYQLDQGGIIGITLNLDWAEPLRNTSADISAAERRNEFGLAWFGDPIFFGAYPQSMIDLVGSRLPEFTADEVQLIKGSVDFLGINHYSTKYFSSCVENLTTNQGWQYDQCTVESKYDVNGALIGPQAGSLWLNVVPWGMYKVLLWTAERYNNPGIFITENGVDSVYQPFESISEALNDTFR